jgi:hypothetical protein
LHFAVSRFSRIGECELPWDWEGYVVNLNWLLIEKCN